MVSVNQQLVFGVLVGVLVVVSAFQALQLSDLNVKTRAMGLALSQISLAPASSNVQQQSSQQAGAGVQLPAGLSNAPNMVGGC